jgi:hypothetical protein
MVPAEALAGLAGVALLGAPGAGLTELLPALRGLPLGARTAHAYLLGVAWTAGWLYALSHGLAVPLRSPAIFAVTGLPLLAGATAWWHRRSRRHHGPPVRHPRRPPRRAARLALLAGGAVTVALFCDALTEPLGDYDGRITWSAHARDLREEGTVDASALTERAWWTEHRRYPLLLPVAQVAVLEATHADLDHHAFRTLYAAFFPVWLLLIHRGARLLAGRQAASWTTLAASLLSFPAFAGAGGAASAYSDLPLACFLGGALLLLLVGRPRRSAAIAAGVLLAAAALAKVEGAALAVATLPIAAVALLWPAPPGRRQRRWRRVGRLALAALPLALALWLLHAWRAGIPPQDEKFEQLASWALLWPGALLRPPELVRRVGTEMLDFSNWGLFWSAAPLVLVAGWQQLRRPSAIALLLAAAAPLTIGWIYATIAVDPGFIVESTWDRFLLQGSVPLLVAVAMAARAMLSPRVATVAALAPSAPPARAHAGNAASAPPVSVAKCRHPTSPA